MNPSTLKWKPIVRQTKSHRERQGTAFRMYTYHVKDYIGVVYMFLKFSVKIKESSLKCAKTTNWNLQKTKLNS